MRPIKGAFAAVGERVTFARGGESFTALNEDAEPFGKVPKRYAAELSLLVEKGYRAEVAGREDGVLTVEVTADEAEPRREQFRLVAYPRSSQERKRVAALAPHSRVYFWDETTTIEILDSEGYPLGKIKSNSFKRARAAHASKYRAHATRNADGSLSVYVSYVVKDDGAGTKAQEDSSREQLHVTSYPRSADEEGRVAALASGSAVAFRDEDDRIEVLDSRGHTLGAIKIGDFERVRAACASAYEAKATPGSNGSLNICVSHPAKDDGNLTEAEAKSADKSVTETAAKAAAAAAAAETAAAETEAASSISPENGVGSTRMSLDVTAYPQNLKQKERIDALPAASDVFFKDEEVIVVVDSQGEKLGALTLDESQSARVAASGDYEAKATPNGNGSLDVAISYSSTTKGEEGAGAVEANGGASDLAKLNELLGKVPLKFLVAGGVVIVLALLLVLLAASRSCALGNHNYEATETVEPTCTVKGYTVYTCSRCDDTYKDDYVAPLGHDLEATETVEATCTEDGYTVYTCSRCGYTYEDDAVDALGHTIEEWSVDKEATCAETGSKSGTCTVCGETITETIAKTDHTEGSWETVSEPTVDSSGDVVPGERQLTCSVCGEVLETEEITVSEIVAALGSFGTFEETTLSGYGDDVVDLPVASIPMLLEITNSGSSNFVVWLLDENGDKVDLLVNEIGRFSGTVTNYLDYSESAMLSIDSSGSWSITCKPMWDMEQLKNDKSYTGCDVLYLDTDSLAKITIKNSGDSNFVVRGIGLYDADLLVNEIGDYSGTVAWTEEQSFLIVESDGTWSVSW